MIVIQLRKYLLHDGFTEKHGLGSYLELLTVQIDGSHFTVVKIYDLPVAARQSLLLLLQIFRIYTGMPVIFLRPCHCTNNFLAKLAFY